MKTTFQFFALCLLPFGAFAADKAALSPYQLPIEINDHNATIRFEVDTTWHMVHGTTSKITGKVWQTDSKDPASISAAVRVPVSAFDTQSNSRDEKLREIMSAETFSDVVLAVESLGKECVTANVFPCTSNAEATITIRDVSKKLSLPLTITRQDATFKVTGSTSLQWADFGIEDPSIFLVAKVQPTVAISYELTIPARQSHE